MARRSGKAPAVPVPELPDDECFVLARLARLANSPYSKGGPITDRLIAKKLLKVGTRDPGWHWLTPLGRRTKAAEFDRRHGFGSLVTKFWGQELS